MKKWSEILVIYAYKTIGKQIPAEDQKSIEKTIEWFECHVLLADCKQSTKGKQKLVDDDDILDLKQNHHLCYLVIECSRWSPELNRERCCDEIR